MVFDGRLVPAGHEKDLLDAVRDQFLNHILHNRLAGHREHFFRLRFGRWPKPGAVSRHRNDCALNHHMNIATSSAAARYCIVSKEKANMEDVQSQLAALRRRIAQIDRKYEGDAV